MAGDAGEDAAEKIDSDALYDNELKREVKRLEKSVLPAEVRQAISEAYWKIGHDMADDRESGVVASAYSLLGLACMPGQEQLKGYTEKFIELYGSEEPLRKARRKSEAERERRKYTPERTFAKELAKLDAKSKFADQEIIHFNSLYGPVTMPDARYVVFHYYPDSDRRPYPYLVGEDGRSAKEIWESIRPVVEERAIEMLENDVVRQYWNGEVDYVGKLSSCDVVIAKELVLPREFKREAEKREKARQAASRKLGPASLESSILSGQLFADLEESNRFNQKMIRILKKDGATISSRTIVDVSVSGHGPAYRQSIELMERVVEVLQPRGYALEELPWMSYGLWDKWPGYARADISELKEWSEAFVGEMLAVAPLLPCGKTYRQRSGETERIWNTFEKECKRGMHKIPPRKVVNPDGTVTITHETPMPELPCGFVDGVDRCSAKWCADGRGEFVKRAVEAGTIDGPKELRDTLSPKDQEAIANVESLVRQLYEAFGKLEEKEDAYR